MPEDMPRERRMEITGESMNSSEITATFSAIDLTDVYDFLEKSFMLTDIVDLPEDVEIQKDKRVSSAKEILKQGIEGKNSHDAWRDEIFDYLSMKHIQGFYIYWMNNMIIELISLSGNSTASLVHSLNIIRLGRNYSE